jgi:hypothetical protein
MRFNAKQRGCYNELIIRRGSLSELSTLEQWLREILTFSFFVPN